MKKIEYFIMRHAETFDYPNNQLLRYRGIVVLHKAVELFEKQMAEKFPQIEKLHIFHSMTPRADYTALLMSEILQNVSVVRTGDNRLNSDKYGITDDYVKEVIAVCQKENSLCLILSHQPDIKFFSGKELRNCQIISMSVLVPEVVPESGEGSDDLPF